MTLPQIEKLLSAEFVSEHGKQNIDIKFAKASDLMSDVLAFIKSNTLLFTGLTTPQVVYTAENAGVNVVCFVRGKKPLDETVALAKEKGIVLIATKIGMFESCGKLYQKGLIGCFESANIDH